MTSARVSVVVPAWNARAHLAEALHAVGASTRQRPDRLLAWHRDRLTYHRIHHGPLGAAWVELCGLAAAADHRLRREARPAPLLRQVASFLVS